MPSGLSIDGGGNTLSISAANNSSLGTINNVSSFSVGATSGTPTFSGGGSLSVGNLTIAANTTLSMGSYGLNVLNTATIDTSTSANATLKLTGRKTFFDEVNNKHWAFYYNGTAIEYAYSADGTTWSTVSTLAYDTPNFSLTYKNISGQGYVFVVNEGDSYDILISRGSVGSNSINFDSAVTAMDGTSSSDQYRMPAVSLDGNNYVWVAATNQFSLTDMFKYQVSARRSTNSAEANLSSWNTASSLGSKSGDLSSLILMPRVGSNMYLLLSAESKNITAYTFNGSSWISSGSNNDYSWFTFPSKGISGVAYAMATYNGELYVGGQFGSADGLTVNNIAKYDGSNWTALGSGTDNQIRALRFVGSDLYVGGYFLNAGGISANYVAKWDGTSWSALGSGVNSYVLAFESIGSDIYVAGNFGTAGGLTTIGIAKWNGTSWSTLGSGLNNRAHALKVIGSNLYAGGTFTVAGGVSAVRLAKWNGSSWSSLGGLDNTVFALASINTDLYVGGAFTTAGGITANRIAKWDSVANTWSSLGTGMNSTVNALAVIGNDVYAGGNFDNVNGVAAINRIAKWDGNTWSALDIGLSSTVQSLEVFGSDLIVGGSFFQAGPTTTKYIAKWNGANWSGYSSFSGPDSQVSSMCIFNNDLYIGGSFTRVGNINAKSIAKWDGNTWSAIADVSGSVNALSTYGGNLYIGGTFYYINGILVRFIAKWNGTAISLVGTGMGGQVYTLTSIETGTKSGLYAGGDFTTAGGISASKIAKWNGSTWSALGSGMSGTGAFVVFSLTVFDADLYVGGQQITTAGGVSAINIAKWNGTSWSALGSGLNGTVYALTAINTGNANAGLYAGGAFTTAGGISANRIAKWNGTSWSALGTGVDSSVNALSALGSNIFVGGNFTTAGGISAKYLAKWDGSTWSNFGSGADSIVRAFHSTGDSIYVGGVFSNIQNKPSAYLAKYSPAVASGSYYSTFDISATTDDNSNLHLVYVDDNGNLIYKQNHYSSGLWSQAKTVISGTISSPNIIVDNSNGQLYVFWIENGNIYSKSERIIDSTSATAWLGSVSILSSTGNNTSINSNTQAVNSIAMINWTSGAGPPYDIKSGTSQLVLSPQNAIITGNWNNNGSFLHNNGLVTFNGSNLQNITANNSSFYNLTTANNSSSGIKFLDSASINGTLTNNTGASKLTFNSGSTYNLSNIDLHGNSGNSILLRSSTPGSSYNFNVSQANPAVSYLDVQDANASGGNEIDATNNCVYSGNNTNWNFLTYTLSGTVTYNTTPVSGAAATFNGIYDGAINDSSDTNGEFQISGLHSGQSYTLALSHPQYNISPANSSGTFTTDESQSFTASLKQFDISGTITEAGTPQNNITVNLCAGAGVTSCITPLASTSTNASGVYQFSNYDAFTAYTVVPAASGHYFTATSSGGTGGSLLANSTHNFTKAIKKFNLQGTVLIDGTTAATGVQACISGYACVTTNASGVWTIPNVDFGTSYSLSFSGTGYLTFGSSGGTLNNDTLSNEATVNTGNVTATIKKFNLSGVILSGGNPLAGVQACLSGYGCSTSNGSGAFTISNVNFGTNYTLTFSHQCYQNFSSVTGTLNNNALANGATISLGNITSDLKLLSISGTISDGSPLSGIDLALSGDSNATTTSNGSGYYEFTGLSCGSNYRVDLTTAPGYSYAFTPSSYPGGSGTVALLSNVTQNFLKAIKTFNITATVLIDGVSPAAGVQACTAGISCVTTNSSGVFTISNVIFNTNYDFTFSGTGYTSFDSLSGILNNDSYPNGSTINLGTVNASIRKYNLTGAVLSAGNPVSGVQACVASNCATTNASGVYTINNVNFGTNTNLNFSHTCYNNFSSVSINLNDDNFANGHTFTLADATADLRYFNISGTLSNNFSLPLSGYTVNLSGSNTASTTTNPSGYYEFTSISCNSTYRVTPSAGSSGYTFLPASEPLSGYNLLTGNLTQNFSASKFGSVTGTVYRDDNRNAVKDALEVGIPNSTVSLYQDINQDELIDSGDLLISTDSTDIDGHYAFENILVVTTGAEEIKYLVFVNESPADFLDAIPTSASSINGLLDSEFVYSLTMSPANNTASSTDFGYFVTGRIADSVWYDFNKDGIYGSDEEGIAGARVFLEPLNDTPDPVFANNVYETRADGSGKYEFRGLAPGTYRVIFESPIPGGYEFTLKNQGTDSNFDSDAEPANGSTQIIEIIAGENDPTIDAGMFLADKYVPDKVLLPGSIGNLVFYDSNQNGIRDPAETGVPGVRVELYSDSDIYISYSITNSKGEYEFSGLSEGTYYLKFTPDARYTISPANQAGDDNIDSDANPADGLTANISIVEGLSIDNIHAGVFLATAPVAISNYVWFDEDADGLQSVGETGVPGVQVRLYRPNPMLNEPDEYISLAVTSNDGQYSFANIPPDNYYIKFTPPQGFNYTSINVGVDDTIDSDAHNISGKSATLDLSIPGTDIDHIDCGLILEVPGFAQLGDKVFLDANANGVRDAGENEKVPNVQVHLYKYPENVFVATSTSDANGDYIFDTVFPGTYFIYVSNIPAGHSLTLKDQVLSGDPTPELNDSDINPQNNRSDSFSLNFDSVRMDLDIGIYPTTSINGKIFYDNFVSGVTELDGQFNSTDGDLGLNAVEVSLYFDNNSDGLLDDNDSFFKKVNTSGSGVNSGTFNFTGVPYNDGNGDIDYLVVVTDSSSQLINFSHVNLGNSKDPLGYPIKLASSAADNTAYFAYSSALGSVSGYYWYDTDEDGIKDSNEPAVVAGTVTLYAVNSGQTIATTITDSSGFYTLSGTPQNYQVRFTLPSIIYTFTATDTSGSSDNAFDRDINIVAIDSDCNPNGHTASFNLQSNAENNPLDAGLIPAAANSTGSISGLTWFDDEDGIRQNNETLLAGIEVELRNSSDNSLVASTITSSANHNFGKYSFNAVPYGDYYVQFVAINNYQFTIANVGSDDSRDSDADSNTAKSASFSLNSASFPNLDAGINYGAITPATIGNYVWLDNNINGLQESTEDGVLGVIIELYDLSNNLIKSTTTSGSGAYQLTNIYPGNYYVLVKPDPFFALTIQNGGSDDNLDSDANPTTKKIGPFTLNDGQVNNSLDIGLRLQFGDVASLGGVVWEDFDFNGIQDNGEPGIGGVKVDLFNIQGVYVATTYTTAGAPGPSARNARAGSNDPGAYEFTNLVPGTYYIQTTLPNSNYIFSPQNAGSDSFDSDVNRITGRSLQINVVSGENNSTISAGMVRNNVSCPAIDFDLDGLINSADLDSDGDGVANSVDGNEDPDEDGLPNYLDLDSDADGIPDMIEVQVNAYTLPANQDSDFNGIDNIFDLGLTPVDTDGDNIPDYLDIDSDNDGINDNFEMQPATIYIPSFQTDSDCDGLDDAYDSDSSGTDFDGSYDGDNTSIPDYREIPTQCTAENLVARSFEMDGIGTTLNDLVKQAVQYRRKVTTNNLPACKALSKKAANNILRNANADYLSIWTTSWSIPALNYVCSTAQTPNCAAFDMTYAINLNTEKAQKLHSILRKTIKSCTRNNKIKRLRRQAKGNTNRMLELVEDLPNPAITCN